MRASRTLRVETPEVKLPELIPVIEDELDLIGHASIVGQTLTWSPAAQGSEGRQIVVTVRPRGEGTEVHLDERLELTGWRQAAPGMGAGFGMLFGLFLALMMGLQEAAILVTAVPSGALGAEHSGRADGNRAGVVGARREGMMREFSRRFATLTGLCIGVCLVGCGPVDADRERPTQPAGEYDAGTLAAIERIEKDLLPRVRVEGESGWTLAERMDRWNVEAVSVAVIADFDIA
jgi:hypothetical protein